MTAAEQRGKGTPLPRAPAISRTRFMRASLVALLAVGAMSAGPASADSPLILKRHGQVLSNTAPIEAEVLLTVRASKCWEWAALHGTLIAGLGSKDTATFSSDDVEFPCDAATEDRLNPFGNSGSRAIVTNPAGGFIKRIELTSAGHLTVRASPSLRIRLRGCQYQATKLQGNFAIPGMAFAKRIVGVAKLSTRRSRRGCARRLRVEGYADLVSPETETEPQEPIEAEG